MSDLLATNHMSLLHEVNSYLSQKLDKGDMSEASFRIDIKIHRDRSLYVWGLSQVTYINKNSWKISMKEWPSSLAPIVKCNMFNFNQCPNKTLNGIDETQCICFSCWSSMYAQVILKVTLLYGWNIGNYQGNPGLAHWRVAKKLLMYLKRN